MRGAWLLLPLILVACRTRVVGVDHAGVLASALGSLSRVVVVPSDGATDATVVAHLRAWKRAGTHHVLNLDPQRPASATGLFRLAQVIEIAGPGPHAILEDAAVRAALEAARERGVLIVGER